MLLMKPCWILDWRSNLYTVFRRRKWGVSKKAPEIWGVPRRAPAQSHPQALLQDTGGPPPMGLSSSYMIYVEISNSLQMKYAHQFKLIISQNLPSTCPRARVRFFALLYSTTVVPPSPWNLIDWYLYLDLKLSCFTSNQYQSALFKRLQISKMTGKQFSLSGGTELFQTWNQSSNHGEDVGEKGGLQKGVEGAATRHFGGRWRP